MCWCARAHLILAPLILSLLGQIGLHLLLRCKARVQRRQHLVVVDREALPIALVVHRCSREVRMQDGLPIRHGNRQLGLPVVLAVVPAGRDGRYGRRRRYHDRR